MASLVVSSRLFALVGTSHLVKVVLETFTGWVADGAATLVNGVGTFLTTTSAVPLGASFDEVYLALRRVGLAFGLLFVAAAVIQAVLRQDLALLVRMLTVRLPLAVALSGVAIWLVEQALAVTDSLSATVIGSTTGTTEVFLVNLAGLLSGPFSATGGFEGLVLAVFAAVVAFVLLIELVVRAAAVEVASLFLPLALAGMVWPATAHWIRRLAETIASLVLAKLVIASVLALAIASLGTPAGFNGLLDGVALLLLATLSPWAIFRLLPFVEAETAAQLESFSGRAHRALRSETVAGLADAVLPGRSVADDLATARPQLPLFPSTVPDGDFSAEIAAEAARIGPPTAGSQLATEPPREPEA